MKAGQLFAIGFLLVLAGVAMVVAGAASSPSASFGGVVFIGPFPIAFGEGPGSGFLALAALVIGAVMVVVFLLSALLSRKARESNRGP